MAARMDAHHHRQRRKAGRIVAIWRARNVAVEVHKFIPLIFLTFSERKRTERDAKKQAEKKKAEREKAENEKAAMEAGSSSGGLDLN